MSHHIALSYHDKKKYNTLDYDTELYLPGACITITSMTTALDIRGRLIDIGKLDRITIGISHGEN